MDNREDIIKIVQNLSGLSDEQRQAMLDEFQGMDDEQIAVVLEYMKKDPARQSQLQKQAADTFEKHVNEAHQRRKELIEKYSHKALQEVDRLKKN